MKTGPDVLELLGINRETEILLALLIRNKSLEEAVNFIDSTIIEPLIEKDHDDEAIMPFLDYWLNGINHLLIDLDPFRGAIANDVRVLLNMRARRKLTYYFRMYDLLMKKRFLLGGKEEPAYSDGVRLIKRLHTRAKIIELIIAEIFTELRVGDDLASDWKQLVLSIPRWQEKAFVDIVRNHIQYLSKEKTAFILSRMKTGNTPILFDKSTFKSELVSLFVRHLVHGVNPDTQIALAGIIFPVLNAEPSALTALTAEAEEIGKLATAKT